MAGRTREEDPKDQIVVATDHLDLVGRELGSGAIVSTVPNPRLGLSLVTLADPAAAGRMLEQRRIDEFPDARAPEVGEDPDRVLAELRLLSERRYCGWVPTLGKNRTLDGVEFKPYTHGFDKPTPTRRPTPVTGRAEVHGEKVRVGLFDTRIAAHEQLEGRYLAGPDAVVTPPAQGRPRLWWEGHATFIAGIIRRHAPSAVLDVRTALLSEPDGAQERWTMPLWTFAERLAEYQDAGVEVLNLSVGVATGDGRPPLVLQRAIAQLTPSMVVVAAAGNHGMGGLSDEERKAAGLPARGAALFPAALDDVLAVGALDGRHPGRVDAAFTPRGAHATETAPWIDVFAPGVETVSTYLGDAGRESVLVRDADGHEELLDFDGWASWSGTSFAAGEITGEIAALLAQGHTAPAAVAEVRQRNPRPEAGLGA
jgi:subtilisin family serine protease